MKTDDPVHEMRTRKFVITFQTNSKETSYIRFYENYERKKSALDKPESQVALHTCAVLMHASPVVPFYTQEINVKSSLESAKPIRFWQRKVQRKDELVVEDYKSPKETHPKREI